MRSLMSALGLWLVSMTAVAGGSVEDGGVTVHYSATPTMELAPEIARRYGIERRNSHAIVLISPRRDGQALSAEAVGVARRLTGQRQSLDWRSVEIEGQRDLIAEFEIQNGEQMALDLSVLAEGAPRPIEIRFLQKFYRR